jgi:mono/diheme cytochrome c family protein
VSLLKRSWSKGMGLLLVLIVGILATACEPGEAPFRSTGAYPIDIFPEMHYNASFKAQEPPRLSPPVDSVPISGKAVALPALRADASDLVSPATPTAAALEHAAALYIVNCAMCHGVSAGGDGFVGEKFAQYILTKPPAFNSQRIQGLTAGEAFWSITSGFGFMPAFGNLLSAEDRWHLVHLAKVTQSEREALLRNAQD